MLLKQITLTNFRQFSGKHTVVFSEDRDRNVTVIMGENGAGKTTFAQAFRWCLYGSTDFADPNVFSKAKIGSMASGDEETSSVEIVLIHASVTYTISRSQKYRIERSGNVKALPTKLSVSYKSDDGQQKFIAETQADGKVREILPKELSGYFFFDGERINVMSKEISQGQGKSTFGDAVRGLLGLDTFKVAMKHLKEGSGRNNVVGQYTASYSSSSDASIRSLSVRQEQLQSEHEKKKARIEVLKDEIPRIQSEIEKLNAIIERNKDGERLKKEIRSLQASIENNNVMINSATRTILSYFQKNYIYYFSGKLMADAMELLANTEQIDKGVPDIHERTINYLMNRGICICGNPITEGSAECMQLQKLLQYIPPQSIGTLVRNFALKCKTCINSRVDLFDLIQDTLKDLTTRQESNTNLQQNIENIEEQLKGFTDIGEYQRRLEKYRDDLRRKTAEKEQLIQELGNLETKIERVETEIREHSLKSKNNRQIEVFKAYALRLYEVLKEQYTEKETEIRKELETSINEIYSDIYSGEVTLQIDSNYNIRTNTAGFINVETGTAQGISIIFAFIAGVIKMARKNDKNDLLSTEPYPLVMDAPLSSFDKNRIQTVCETLPNIAEQVIIFIKDTDGDIAQKHLSEKIGKQYSFKKVNELETIFE